MVQIKPQEVYVPETQIGVRYHIWRLVTSPPFENFIMLLIILNTLLLMCKVYNLIKYKQQSFRPTKNLYLKVNKS